MENIQYGPPTFYEFITSLRNNGEKLPDEISNKITRRCDQRYWEYFTMSEDRPELDSASDIVERANGQAIKLWHYGQYFDQAIEAILHDERVLLNESFVRFAEYFGAIPTSESGYIEYRSYEDRSKAIYLRSENLE